MKKILIVVISLVFVSACTKEPLLQKQQQPDLTLPTLSFPFVSFASATKFIPFGGPLSGSGVSTGYEIQLTNTSEAYVASCSGIISSIILNSRGSYDIAVNFRKNSIYSMLYSGVTNVLLSVNDSINPGTILGKVNSTGLIDFYLLQYNSVAICPDAYGSPGFNTAIGEAIIKNNLFHPGDLITGPCLAGPLRY